MILRSLRRSNNNKSGKSKTKGNGVAHSIEYFRSKRISPLSSLRLFYRIIRIFEYYRIFIVFSSNSFISSLIPPSSFHSNNVSSQRRAIYRPLILLYTFYVFEFDRFTRYLRIVKSDTRWKFFIRRNNVDSNARNAAHLFEIFFLRVYKYRVSNFPSKIPGWKFQRERKKLPDGKSTRANKNGVLINKRQTGYYKLWDMG